MRYTQSLPVLANNHDDTLWNEQTKNLYTTQEKIARSSQQLRIR